MLIDPHQATSRHRAAEVLQLPARGSGRRRTPREEALIDAFLWLRAQFVPPIERAGRYVHRCAPARLRLLLAEAAYEIAALALRPGDSVPLTVTIAGGEVFLATEDELLELLAAGACFTVIRPPDHVLAQLAPAERIPA